MRTSEESSAVSSFTPFPRLPLELRLKIWSYTLTPQTISFHIYENLNPPPNPPSISTLKGTVIAAPPRIPLWDINHETRSWAQTQGILSLLNKPPKPQSQHWAIFLSRWKLDASALAKRILFSPAHDILALQSLYSRDVFLELPDLIPLLPVPLARSVRSLRICFVDFSVLVAASPAVWGSEGMGRLEGLEMVVVVGERFGDRAVQLECHLLRKAFEEAKVQGREWRMPGFRFVAWESGLEDALRVGRVRELEGLDPEDFLWTR